MVESRPDTRAVLAQLKDFQRNTVEYVHHRLWLDDDPAYRFLVADEVGLGKTMVAKGVIARTLDHLWDNDDERIDLVYICSNAQIARQNVGRLNITGDDLNHADRLTLLARHVADLRSRRVNVVSFTPGTSFQISEAAGRVEERAFVYALLRSVWGRATLGTSAWRKFFHVGAAAASFDRELGKITKDQIDPEFAQALVDELKIARLDDGQPLKDALESCVSEFRYLREGSKVALPVRQQRLRLIGRMRAAVASAAIGSLRPRLVILDEFQRFKTLLDESNPTAQLAHALFNQPNTRVLMLSATPYKMYTLPNEPEGDDHYADFAKTIEFLAGHTAAAAVSTDLAIMRRGVLDTLARDAAITARDRVEAELRRHVSRTERLASTPDRDGMLQQRAQEVELTAADVQAFRTSQAVAKAIANEDVLEYWRSTPYLFNMMDSYKVKEKFNAGIVSEVPDLAKILQSGEGLLDWDALRAYRRLDPSNAKMRALARDVIDSGAWKLTWLPPCLPYYALGGAYAQDDLATFTKRLVFSAWQVVPKAIATLLSYDAERAAATRVEPDRQHGSTPRPLLNFSRSDNRLSGLPVPALLYPSVTLARASDPLDLAREIGELPVPRARFEAKMRDRIEALLDELPAGPIDGPVDQAWYWAVPFLLDRQLGTPQTEFVSEMLAWGNVGDDDASTSSAQHDHIVEAATFDPSRLGRRPNDLAQVIGLLAVAGPGNAALRALHRVGSSLDLADVDLRVSATYVSWAVRRLLNQPHIIDIVRYGKTDDAYWRAALNHSYEGCLQSVLDEWVHILVETEGTQSKSATERARIVSKAIDEAMGLRTSANLVDDIRVSNGTVTSTRQPLNAHFAVRFGRDASDTEKVIDREKAVRGAFNSPFWPFVLASTSVGQEGLDFHLYSHAVVHWNLPSNPVDLEQREGRVHRYKNHAVRKNVATKHGQAILDPTVVDPWAAVFAAAYRDRPEGETDLVPYWVFAPPGGAVIERYVPALPLSLESARLRRLQRTVGAYRLVFGQPRQDDLLSYVQSDDEDASWLAIDLTPPAASINEVLEPSPTVSPEPSTPAVHDRTELLRTMVMVRTSDEHRAALIVEYLSQAQFRFGVVIEPGTSERFASGESDYLMMRDVGPQRFGAIVYVTPRNANLNFRLREDHVVDLMDRVILRDVRDGHQYQVRIQIERQDDVELAMVLTQRALEIVRQ